MAQHDYVIANQSGSAFRADLNNALSATVTGNSGSSAPSTTYAYMIWNDTTSNQRKIRNSANNAWIVLSTLSGGNVFDDDVTFNGASYNLVWDKSDNALEFADNAKCTFGDSDLQIYHDGTHNQLIASSGYVKLEATTNDLYLRGNTVWVQSGDGNETFIKGIDDGAVELYHDNEKKLYTQSWGVTVADASATTAWLELVSSDGTCGYLVGQSNAGSGSEKAVAIYNAAGNETHFRAINNKGVELYFDNVVKLETLTDGLRTKDNQKFCWGDGFDLQIYHNGTDSKIINFTGNLTINATDSEPAINIAPNGAVDLYYDGTKRLATTNSGATITAGNNSYGLWVDCNDTSYASVVLNVECDRNTTDETYSHIGCHRSGVASVFFVRDSGNVENANNSYGSTSDERLKENIVDAGSQWDDIKNLKVRKFNFKETTDPDKKTMIGLVAQEAEKISPGLVSESKSMQGGVEGTYKTVKYSILYMKAIKALQEAMAKIETLETKVAALEAK